MKKFIKNFKRFFKNGQYPSTTLRYKRYWRSVELRERDLDRIRMSPGFSDYLEKSNRGMSSGNNDSFIRTH